MEIASKYQEIIREVIKNVSVRCHGLSRQSKCSVPQTGRIHSGTRERGSFETTRKGTYITSACFTFLNIVAIVVGT